MAAAVPPGAPLGAAAGVAAPAVPPGAAVPAAAAAGGLATNTGGVTKDDLIRIGRPNGPDLQLKFDPANLLDPQTATANVANIIQNDSSITEVLNVISFLTSVSRTFTDMVDATNSAYDGTAKGAIDAATGFYADPPAVATNFAAATLDLNTLDVTAPAANLKIPVSILKRRGAAAVPTDPDSFQDMTQIFISNAVGDVKALFSDCVKQMIKLLQQTRTILGPKGWTDLFQKVKGGSKKTQHRRHRRRYSSKQY